jgi:hypothetical protein
VKAKSDVSTVLGGTDDLYKDFVAQSNAYLDARGLPTNSFSMNGIVINDHTITDNLMQLVGR